RGEGAMDVAGVTLPAEVGQVARVVHVRVAEDDGIDLFRIERKTTIAPGRFFPMALEKAAFEQQFFPVDLEEIHRAGRRAGGAEKVDFHGGKMRFRRGKSSGEMA